MKSENLKSLEKLILGKKHGASFSYEGGAFGEELYFGEDAAVLRGMLKAGSKFSSHSHNSTEVVVVVSGRFFTTSALATVLTPTAGVIVFPPLMEHSHHAETDCVIIAITIPADEGYPHE